METPVPPSKEPDIYDYGFDKKLKRLSVESTIGNDSEYNSINQISSSNVNLGYMGGGSSTNYIGIDVAQGLWLGDEIFADAPFSVDMTGNVKGASIVITGGTIAIGVSLAAGNQYEVQYNSGAGVLGASSNFKWDNSLKELQVGGEIKFLKDNISINGGIRTLCVEDRTDSDGDGTNLLIQNSSGQGDGSLGEDGQIDVILKDKTVASPSTGAWLGNFSVSGGNLSVTSTGDYLTGGKLTIPSPDQNATYYPENTLFSHNCSITAGGISTGTASLYNLIYAGGIDLISGGISDISSGSIANGASVNIFQGKYSTYSTNKFEGGGIRFSNGKGDIAGKFMFRDCYASGDAFFNFSSISSEKTFTFQDISGSLALLSDISNHSALVSGIHGATSTIATLNDIVSTVYSDGVTITGNGSVGDPLVGSAGSPGGTDQCIQFNNAGGFGGTTIFTINQTAKILTLGVGGDNAYIVGPDATTDDTDGGGIGLVGGLGKGAGAGGNVGMAGADGGTAGAGGGVAIQSGSAGGGDTDGGNIQITLGSGFGTGSTGKLSIYNLPTSTLSLNPGDIWVDTTGSLNILKIV